MTDNNLVDLHDRVTEAYYGELGPNFMEKTRERIHWICKNVIGNNILDVGCSQGLVPILLAREGLKITGLDLSEKSIIEAKDYISKESELISKNIRLVNDNFISYKQKNNEEYSTVIIAEVLEHLIKPENFIKKSTELINKESGCLIVTVPFGINDFIDHKHTYYLYEMYSILYRWFDDVSYYISDTWIGFISKKPLEKENTSKSLLESLFIKDLEAGFYKLESSIRNQLKETSDKHVHLHRRFKKVEKEKNEITINLSNTESKLDNLAFENNNNKKKLASLEEDKKLLVSSLSKLKKEITEKVLTISEQEQEITEKVLTISEQEQEINKLNIEIKNREIKNREIIEKSNFNIEQSRKLRRSTSFRLGNAIILSLKEKKRLFKLPKAIYYIYRDTKKNKYKVKPDFIKKIKDENTIITKASSIKELKKEKEIVFYNHDKDIKNLQGLLKSKIKGRQLKIASIMDEFTYSSFEPEANILELTPLNYLSELNDFKPDILFIESAWKGKDSLWATKVSNISPELQSILQWCKDNDVQTLMWNKEDPVHFDTFVPLAKLVDYVFTTDIDCVPKYKKAIGHDRVSVLPFAAQPKYHNPIEIYQRKDKFNFAGSYYLRYPERQKDFENIFNAANEFKGVDIHDRNYENPHPHYEFPVKYKPYILGSLPFSQIEKAYKGYKYGINMNTIKQSQTMFARRVFELLASNTVVISNYSRGVRNMFGDLVICSDNQHQLKEQLKYHCSDNINYEKYRLAGMRKVMAEHTYQDRLKFILNKMTNTIKSTSIDDKVLVLSFVYNNEEAENIVNMFNCQNHENKKLILVSLEKKLSIESQEDIQIVDNTKLEISRVLEKENYEYLSIMDKRCFYGDNYLVDLVLSFKFNQFKVSTKESFFIKENELIQVNHDKCYVLVNKILPYKSLIKKEALTKNEVNYLVDGKGYDEIKIDAISIDPFNFIYNTSNQKVTNEESKKVLDIKINNTGHNNIKELDFINKVDTLFDDRVNELSSVTISHIEISNLLPKRRANCIFNLLDKSLSIKSSLGKGKYVYHYLNRYFSRKELNLINNSQIFLDAINNLEDGKIVFEFCDKKKKKISHQMNKIDCGTHSLAIPNECEFIRIGIRMQGSGQLQIKCLNIGNMVEVPAAISGVSEYLVLAKQYPSYDDLYKYGFLHTRVKAYKENGLNVDVFRFTNENNQHYREFEGIDVAQGNAELLDRTLSTGKYKKVLVHLMDHHMWNVLEKYIDNIEVIVWAHGAEIQLWNRRSYEFELMDKNQIEHQKKLSNNRKSFWVKVLTNPHKNFKIVFVSDYFKNEIIEDFQVEIPSDRSKIIHNYIDNSLFRYSPKPEEIRCKVLSIRPYASRKYANDLSVEAVLELSKEEFFDKLEFCFVGDGVLFEETLDPIKHFRNIKLIKRFMKHEEISKMHKDYGIFLTPTRMDAQGVSRDEAMSSGLVPITSEVAAIPEFVDESCAILAPPEDSKGLAEGIKELYLNPDLFIEMSKNSAKRVRNQSGFNNTIQKEMELIKI